MTNFFDQLQSANISLDRIENLLSKGKLLKVKSKSLLVQPGTICDKVYFVLKGGFVCRYIDKELEIEKTINFYLENLHPFMSCVDSYFSGTQTHCELRAVAYSEVLEFNKKDVDAMLLEDTAFFQFYHFMVTRAFQEENDFKLKIISYEIPNPSKIIRVPLHRISKPPPNRPQHFKSFINILSRKYPVCNCHSLVYYLIFLPLKT